MMIYRLLALNIDGTLLQSNGKLHKSTREALDYVQQKGIYVTLVTSRSFPSAKKVARALKLKSLLVTHQGAYISGPDAKPIYVKRISEDVTYDIVRFLESFSCQIRIVHEQFSLSNKLRINNNLLAKTVFTSGDPVLYSQQFVEDLSETLAEQPVSPPKIEVYFEHKKDAEDAKAGLKAMFLEVTADTLNPYCLEILPQGVSKMNGLLYLGEHLGIRRKEMVYIGSDLDDIPLIEEAGLGVAMGNARFEVKKAADWVTRSENEQGVAYMVKEHFRKQQPLEFLKKMNIIK